MFKKRDNNFEEVSFDKILERIKILCISESFDKKLNYLWIIKIK